MSCSLLDSIQEPDPLRVADIMENTAHPSTIQAQDHAVHSCIRFFLLQSFLNCVVRNTSSIKSRLQVFHGLIRPLGIPPSQGIGNSYARLPAWCPGYRERDTVHSYGFLQKKRACSYHIHAEILKRAAASSFSSPSTLMVIVLIIKKPPQVQYQYIVLIQATRTGDRKVLRRQVQA